MPSQQTPLNFRIDHASKAYHGVPALIAAQLELRGGEVHGLIGENGAGKSTLIKLIAGVVSADTLAVTLNGRPIQIENTADARKAGLRFIHQEMNIVPSLSVAENIFISQSYPRRGMIFVDWERIHRSAADLMARLGITHIDVRQNVSQLKAGDAMLVRIASAFAGQDLASLSSSGRLIYVMDEPTASLNNAESERLFAVIETLVQHGCAVLYVTHRLDELQRLAQRVTVMRDGRVISTHPMRDVSPDQLIEEMTGRSLNNIFPPRESALDPRLRLEVRAIRTAAVRHASFTLRCGEVVGIAGLNGAGRSELLRALFGVDPVEGGEILLDGEPVPQLSPAVAWQQGIAYVPEERRTQGLVMGESIRANMMLPHLERIRFMQFLLDQRRETRIADELGTAVRLKAVGSHQHVRELSGGNQQKTLFGRALVRQPRLLLLDEPTRGVDIGAKFDIYRMIRELSAQQISILMVSSELGELLGMCDRILIMRDRSIVGETQAAGLTEKDLLSLCYGYRKEGQT